MASNRIIRHGINRFRRDGLRWLVAAVVNRLFPPRPALGSAAIAAVENRRGIEIGGPSRVFARGGMLPLYPRVSRLDNVNFASQTAWEAGLRDRGDFKFDAGKPSGCQFLREATCLTGLDDNSYDFVLSSHCLEHVANPLAALHEWRRIVRPGGFLILVLPDPRRSFDHARPVTTMDHLRADFTQRTGEDDRTHLDEIFAHHDLGRDPHAGRLEEFRARAHRNAENRCLHHHVFNLALIRAALEETGWAVHELETVRPLHLIATARKPP